MSVNRSNGISLFELVLVFFFVEFAVAHPVVKPWTAQNLDRDHNPFGTVIRPKRQFDFSISAEHDDEEGTDIFAEATARLWESQDGNTRIDGSAKVIHHGGPFASSAGSYRFGVKVVFE